MKTYENRTDAMQAAIMYQKQYGGTFCDGQGEDTDDNGRIVGTYEFVAVAQGATKENPLGDSWEEFPYNYTEI